MRGIVSDHALFAPASLDETLALLAQGNVRPLAGGTDVMVELAAGKLPPGRWVSIWQHDELRGITVRPDEIVFGALTTYSDVRAHEVVARELPMLVQAASESGAWAIQNRGTLGGNIVNASPAADSPPALLAYEAQLELLSTQGRRRVPYAGFHTGYKQMQRRPDELVAAIVVPRRPWLDPQGTDGPRALHVYTKVGTRKAQAISKVCVAALGVVEGGAVRHFRAALGSVAPVVLEARQTAAALEGSPADASLGDRAADAIAKEIAPIDDVRSTAGYRARVSANLLRDIGRMLAAGETGARCG